MVGDKEVILAQEQGVMARSSFERQVEGTLILTNQRLLFVGASQEEEIPGGFGVDSLRFADVNSLDSLPNSQYNISIPLGDLSSEKASHLGHPSLKVRWNDRGEQQHEEFEQKLIGGRKKNLNDWARVIEKIKSGALTPEIQKTPPPGTDTLKGKILYTLGDMQEKGSLEIEEQVETSFKIDLDPDQVEDACKKLVEDGLVDVVPDSSGDDFYRKHSPLGEDDLSS